MSKSDISLLIVFLALGSLVAIPTHSIALLSTSTYRVNVALSRAQHGMYIIGNAGEGSNMMLCMAGAIQPRSSWEGTTKALNVLLMEPHVLFSGGYHCLGMLESRAGTIWSESVIPTLKEKDALGPTLELQCARHEVRKGSSATKGLHTPARAF